MSGQACSTMEHGWNSYHLGYKETGVGLEKQQLKGKGRWMFSWLDEENQDTEITSYKGTQATGSIARNF